MFFRTLGSLGNGFPANSWAHLKQSVLRLCRIGVCKGDAVHRGSKGCCQWPSWESRSLPSRCLKVLLCPRIWLGHTSAAEVNMWRFGPLGEDVFHYPSALCCSEASCLSREPSGKVFAQSKDKRKERDEMLV